MLLDYLITRHVLYVDKIDLFELLSPEFVSQVGTHRTCGQNAEADEKR